MLPSEVTVPTRAEVVMGVLLAPPSPSEAEALADAADDSAADEAAEEAAELRIGTAPEEAAALNTAPAQ